MRLVRGIHRSIDESAVELIIHDISQRAGILDHMVVDRGAGRDERFAGEIPEQSAHAVSEQGESKRLRSVARWTLIK